MKPSIRAILWNDWPALACWIGVPIVWVVAFSFPLFHRNAPDLDGLVVFSVIAMALLLGCLSWRLYRVFRLFKWAVVVPGSVISVSIAKDRGRLDYAYSYRDESFYSWCPVHKTARVLSFSRGQEIRVLIDPNAPKQSVVVELFQ